LIMSLFWLYSTTILAIIAGCYIGLGDTCYDISWITILLNRYFHKNDNSTEWLTALIFEHMIF